MALRLLNRVGQAIRECDDKNAMLEITAELFGKELSVDRCTIMLAESAAVDDEVALVVQAEFLSDSLQPLLHRRYQLKLHSELCLLLQEGKPVPLSDIALADLSSSYDVVHLQRLVFDSVSKSVVAFPLLDHDKIIGIISLHHSQDALTFSDEVLELGEAISDELMMSLERVTARSSVDSEDVLFKNIHMPGLLVDRAGRIQRANKCARKTFLAARKDWSGLTLRDIVVDAQRLLDGLGQLSKNNQSLSFNNILVSHSDTRSLYLDVCLCLISDQDETTGDALVLLHPEAQKQKTGVQVQPESSAASQAQQLTNNLSRQLSWERWVRQIICKLHSSLDRDTLLQAVVDGFGRALGASRCLIVRTDTPATPMVTHEYAEPDISPLGLGRTGQFPTAATSYFRHKAAAIADLTELERSGELSDQEYEYFLDNNIRSMAGAPITAHGIKYGVIIILESVAGRTWTSHELDMLEITATQTAVALSHSQQYLQLKDQLFNMNLLGNLTQQLTNTLELASRGGKVESMEEKRAAGTSPPLSLRELEVLKLIASGLANREIAQRLFLTESTVELHASRIRKKLKLKSRTALVKYACDNGLA